MTSSKSWTSSFKDLANSVAGTAKSFGQKAYDAGDDAYRRLTGNGGTHSKMSTNSNFHTDARQIARDAERLKDDALRDADKRFK